MKYDHVHNFNHFDHICEFEIALLVCGDNTIFVQEDRYNRDVPITLLVVYPISHNFTKIAR